MDAPILHIEIDEYGAARTINGHVKVRMIAQKHLTARESVEEVAAHYDIEVADVYAALAYYHDNRASYDRQDRELESLIEAGKQRSAELKARI
ncbi:MAG: DUF433 domain-containing protein, partial [Chloroflexota bacterium]